MTAPFLIVTALALLLLIALIFERHPSLKSTSPLTWRQILDPNCNPTLEAIMADISTDLDDLNTLASGLGAKITAALTLATEDAQSSLQPKVDALKATLAAVDAQVTPAAPVDPGAPVADPNAPI